MTQKDHLLSIIGIRLDQSPSLGHGFENSLPDDTPSEPPKGCWLAAELEQSGPANQEVSTPQEACRV